MEKIKVGDYVRTNDGGIGKIIKCPFKSMYLDEIWGDINNTATIITDNVYKTSPNIIDLIEVGDYVNGYKVTTIALDKGKRIGVVVDNDIIGFDIDEIKTIVTKEQFEELEYKL